MPVLPEWTSAPIEIRVVFPSRSGLFPRTRALIDLLASRASPLIEGAEQMAGEEGTPGTRPGGRS